MSMRTYVEALEFVLDTELDARGDLICLRPGARRALGETERDVPLPRIGRKAFSVALGAALQGAHPVLDLRQEDHAAQLMEEAVMELPAGMSPVITVISCAQDAERFRALPDAYVFEPRTPRQAAGFLRSALKMPRLTIVLADQSLFAETDDIPEDRSFALLPLDNGGDIDEQTAYDEAEAEEAPVVMLDDEAAAHETEAAQRIATEAESAPGEAQEEPMEEAWICDEAPPENEEMNGKLAVGAQRLLCPARMTKCDLTELHSLAEKLELDAEYLVERCAGHVLPDCGGFEMHYEPRACRDEAAFIPPVEEVASIWLGNNMLTISYDALQLAHADAAKLLHAVKRVLEMPLLLIYDKEYEKP